MDQEESEGTSALPLITKDNICLTNEFIQKFKDVAKTPINFDDYDNYDSFFFLFEEFVAQHRAFFFDFENTEKLLDLTEQFYDEIQAGKAEEEAFEVISPSLSEYFQTLQSSYFQVTQSADFAPQCRLFLPFDISKFQFYLIEVNPILQTIFFFYTEKPKQDEQIEEELQAMVALMEELFNCAGFNQVTVLVDNESRKHLIKYSNQIYVKYLLSVFNILYEIDMQSFAENPNIFLVDEKTIFRLNHCLNAMKNVYACIESDFEGYQMNFISKIEQYQEEQKCFAISQQFQTMDQQELQVLIANEIDQIMGALQVVNYSFLHFEIVYGEASFSYFVHACKNTDPTSAKKYELNLYMLDFYDESMNGLVGQTIFSLENEDFSFGCCIDFSRHNGLYEYSQVTLGMWVSLVVDKGLKCKEAFSLISYSFVPNFCLLQE